MNEIYNYVLFAWCAYYPNGGMNDARATADTVDELKKFYEDNKEEKVWARGQIVDSRTFKVVEKLQ